MLMVHLHASALTLLVYYESMSSCVNELSCVAPQVLLVAEVEKRLTFQAPMQASANKIALCKYPSSANSSQSHSSNTVVVVTVASDALHQVSTLTPLMTVL